MSSIDRGITESLVLDGVSYYFKENAIKKLSCNVPEFGKNFFQNVAVQFSKQNFILVTAI